MVKRKRPGRRSGPIGEVADTAIRVYDAVKDPVGTLARETVREAAGAADRGVLRWKRRRAARKAWRTRRRRYGPSGRRSGR